MSEDVRHKEILAILEKQNEMLKGISSRQDKHEQADTERFESIPNKVDIKEVVEETMKEVFYSGSKWTYRTIIVVAVIFGSLIAIGGGLKMVLAWFGFNRI